MTYANKVATWNLQDTADSNLGDISQHIRSTKSGAQVLGPNGVPVARFGQQGIQLGETRELFSFPRTTKGNDVEVRKETLSHVLGILNTTDISLNHVGFGYQVEDLDTETERIVEIMKGSAHHVYEDPEGRKEHMRRLFIGDNTSNAPMCEIVLPDKKLKMKPHVQYDFDTSLPPEEIAARTNKYFGDQFLDWHLDIENIGRVVSMGTFENRWIDLRVGIGSNLRNREAHRESMERIS